MAFRSTLAVGATVAVVAVVTAAVTVAACPTPRDAYKTNEQLDEFARALERTYPRHARRFDIGNSGRGAPLVGVEISGDVGARAALQPEFKWVANIHGDETVGRELGAQLACLLLTQYSTNATLRALVDNTRIFVLLTMNPDGFAARKRGNANGVDLNRNFPDVVKDADVRCDRPGEKGQRQIETCHVVKWIQQRQFVLGGYFHGGALVVSYGLDGRKDGRGGSGVVVDSPEKRLLEAASLTYAQTNVAIRDGLESPMYGAKDGIINGAAWYSIFGGAQDYGYFFNNNNIDVTFEVSGEYERDKWPPAKDLPQYWEDNRDAMLLYMQYIHRGIKGIVTAPTSCSMPTNDVASLIGVKVVADNENPGVDDPSRNASVVTLEPHGDFFRLLMPGRYTVTFSKSGYRTHTLTNVVVNDVSATVVHVKLECDDDPATAAAAAAAVPLTIALAPLLLLAQLVAAVW